MYLDGVEVKINGKNAFISFLGLGSDFTREFDQINFISPDDNVLGPGVTVEIFMNGALVGSTTTNMGAVSRLCSPLAPATARASWPPPKPTSRRSSRPPISSAYPAGLAPNLTGVYQFNVIMPTLSNGDHAVEIDIMGLTTQANAVVTVENP